MNQASDIPTRPSPEIKRGTRRDDGKRFYSYLLRKKKDGTKVYQELWLSNEAWDNKIASNNRWQTKNKKRRSDTNRAWRKRNADRHTENAKKWRYANKEKFTAYQKQWVEKNRDNLRARLRKWDTEMRATRPDYRLKRAMRGRINIALRGIRKLGSTVKLLGCDLETLRNWLESQFVDGMSWENYGPVWHVDHVVPISWFDLSCEESQKRAFNYKNLQPLFAEENCKKGNRYAGRR